MPLGRGNDVADCCCCCSWRRYNNDAHCYSLLLIVHCSLGSQPQRLINVEGSAIHRRPYYTNSWNLDDMNIRRSLGQYGSVGFKCRRRHVTDLSWTATNGHDDCGCI